MGVHLQQRDERAAGSQQFRFDNAAPHSASKIWINNLDLDGVDIANYLSLIGVNDELYTQDKNDSTTYDFFTVTAAASEQGRLHGGRDRLGARFLHHGGEQSGGDHLAHAQGQRGRTRAARVDRAGRSGRAGQGRRVFRVNKVRRARSGRRAFKASGSAGWALRLVPKVRLVRKERQPARKASPMAATRRPGRSARSFGQQHDWPAAHDRRHGERCDAER